MAKQKTIEHSAMNEEEDEWDDETAGIPEPVHRKADQLSQNELSIELEKRDLQATGFWSDDAKKLRKTNICYLGITLFLEL